MEGKAAEARRCRGCAHAREPRRARRSLLANSVLLRLITLDRRFDDVNAAGGDHAATTSDILSALGFGYADAKAAEAQGRRDGLGAGRERRTRTVADRRDFVRTSLNWNWIGKIKSNPRFGWDILTNFLDVQEKFLIRRAKYKPHLIRSPLTKPSQRRYLLLQLVIDLKPEGTVSGMPSINFLMSMKLLATLAAIRLDEAVGNHLIHVPPVRGRRFLRRKL
ncbi:unnamed protein product [Miscanthus lutarioriparius]|uniref:Uncharacterized protein n=1 Tax=Miscanthus lutarioriparius TaxID=422564 RepID=A0A811PA32_9POAL|nr:unnamed protein product [Miscanthus lutarioriparius]